MKSPLVYIIILNWNGLIDTVECLKYIFLLDYPNVRIVVVDNGSIDESPEIIKKNFPQVTLIKSQRNIGFAGGNNIGMQFAMKHGADYIWLLNNDTTVESGCLDKLIRVGESFQIIGMISPMIYYYEDPIKLQFAGGYVNWKTLSINYPDKTKEIGNEFQNGKHVCLWGTALLIKRIVVEKIGLLNEKYFAYHEDIEYSLRVLKAGFQNVVCNYARVYHKHQIVEPDGRGKKDHYYYYMHRNKVFWGNEFMKGFLPRLGYRIMCLAETAHSIGTCHKHYKDQCLNGIWHGLNNIGGPMTDDNGMPKIFKRILCFLSKYHPVVIANLITFDFREIFRRIARIMQSEDDLNKNSINNLPSS